MVQLEIVTPQILALDTEASASPHTPGADPYDLNRLKRSVADYATGSPLRQFYENQNEMIDTFLVPENTEGEEARLLRLQIAIYGSFLANFILFGLQLGAAILSRSLALYATTADSFMDLASACVLVYASRLAAQENVMEYPTGKSRYETAGIIVFATLMSTLSLQIVVTAIETFAAADSNVSFSIISICFIVIALVTKFFLFLYCRTLSMYPSAKILAQDHMNDIIFNSFGILFGVLAQHYSWWLDPTGAILIAVFILRSWAITGNEHIQLLVGKSADPKFLSLLTYLSMTHDDRILKVDTCKAYHSGQNFFVEIDIVLDPQMLLMEAHDIGESLQMKVEALSNVERAFVHLDYETDHKPEHKKYI